MWLIVGFLKEKIIYIYIHTHTHILTNPSTRAEYDTRSIFKQSLTDLNSEFSFS